MKKKAEQAINVTFTHSIPLRRVADLLSCAFDGGSHYWCTVEDQHVPDKHDDDLDFRYDENHIYQLIDYPLNAGGWLKIGALGEWPYEEPEIAQHRIIGLGDIMEGLQVMAHKYPDHFGDFLQENEDAVTGDVFLQCCVFKEVVFG